jgi:hypothetical protein
MMIRNQGIHDVKAKGTYISQDWSSPEKAVQELESNLSVPGRPDLLIWLRGRRDEFQSLLERYSGDTLRQFEEQDIP